MKVGDSNAWGATARSIVLVSVLLLAGCAAPASTNDIDLPPAEGAEPPGTPRTGSLLVVVVTPQIIPIDGALVVVAGLQQPTDAEGKAAFEQVPVGSHVVEIQDETHGTTSATASIEAAKQARLTVKLVQTTAAPAAADEPRQYQLTGYFECSATYVIITGDCMTLVDHLLVNATGACAPVCPGDHTKEEYTLDFPLQAGWTTIVAEMEWDAGTTAGKQMTFALEPTEWDAGGHAPKYARTAGESPLLLRVENGVRHESADASADGEWPGMPQSAGGEVLRTRSYVQGEARNPGGTNFLGVGAAIDQQFEVIVTVFYGEPAPEGFSAT